MRTCPACHIRISDPVDACPLCHHALTNDRSTPDGYLTYPNLTGEIRKYQVVFRVFLFVGICLTAICFFVNTHVRPHFFWSAIVAAFTAYTLAMLWLFLWDAGYLRRIFFGFFGAVGVFVVIDAVTGFNRWSINYGFPSAVILLDITLAALMIFNRKRWESYLVFLIIVILIGLIPLALTYFGLVTRPLVSEIALITAALVFLGALILGGQVARSELHRRFHI